MGGWGPKYNFSLTSTQSCFLRRIPGGSYALDKSGKGENANRWEELSVPKCGDVQPSIFTILQGQCTPFM